MIVASLQPAAWVVQSSRALTPLIAPDVFDAPPHVRAGSGLARWRGQLWVAQDDTRLLVEVRDDGCFGTPLPPGPDGLRQHDSLRGNKRLKADLESMFADELCLWALGSGSAANRDLVVRAAGDGVQMRALPGFYRGLAQTAAFAGSELNVEGATRVGDRLWLANRGNGAGAAVDALGWAHWSDFLHAWANPDAPFALAGVTQVDCGQIDGVRLTLTDLTAYKGALWCLCAAEASPNVYDDGPVVGVAIGRVDGDTLHLGRLVGPDGAPWTEKAEGLVVDEDGAWVVTDADDPCVPASLLRVRPA